MNAMARNLTGEALGETIAHEPESEAVATGPAGTETMPNTMPQGQNRYIYGSGARPLEGYTIKRAIGRGGFGEVYYATSDAGKEVALKLITRNIEIERRGVMQCMNLKSPHLITIYDLKTTEAGDTFVIMEYVAGPSLANILAAHPKGLPMPEVRAWLKGLVEGVAYLHDHGIVHRDLKPANLFMEQGVVKIGDYGLSKLITDSQGTGHSESIGTCHYMAPEISTGKYHRPIDVYAMGVILYEMITGRVPFDGESVGEVLMKHLTARPDLSALAEPFKSIVTRALAKDPAQRPARVYDLLPREDAPRSPNVRFIGDKNAAPTDPKPEPPKADDDVLRIGAEEPVYYIGPDTRPPTVRSPFNQWFWGAQPPRARRCGWDRAGMAQNAADARARARMARAQAKDQARAARAAARRPMPPTPPPLPPPPPLPSGRVRVAEAAGSMLWAAPLLALLTLPTASLFEVTKSAPMPMLGVVFGVALLGTWGVLLANKLWEGRTMDDTTRRLVYLALGLLVGAAGTGLAQWTHVGLDRPGLVRLEGTSRAFADYAGPLAEPNVLGAIAYCGLVFAANGWWKLSARARRSRFRILPVFKAGLVAWLIGLLLWPTLQPFGICVATMSAIAVQLVSPWSEAAARYARATRTQVA